MDGKGAYPFYIVRSSDLDKVNVRRSPALLKDNVAWTCPNGYRVQQTGREVTDAAGQVWIPIQYIVEGKRWTGYIRDILLKQESY